MMCTKLVARRRVTTESLNIDTISDNGDFFFWKSVPHGVLVSGMGICNDEIGKARQLTLDPIQQSVENPITLPLHVGGADTPYNSNAWKPRLHQHGQNVSKT